MKILIRVLIFLIFSTLIDSKYEIILDRIDVPDNEYLFLNSCRVKKFNRSSTILDGVWEFRIPLGDSIDVTFEAFNFAGGQYKKLFGRFIGSFCQNIYEKHLEKDVRYWFDHTNLSVAYGTCPIPPQIVNTTGWSPAGLGDYLPPYVPGSERWKVSFWFSQAQKVMGSISFYAIIRDEQKLFDSTFG